MNKMVSQLTTRSLQLLTCIIALSTLTACGNDSSTSAPIAPDKETVTQTATPEPLRKLNLPAGGTLRAFIVIDNDRLNPIDMSIGNDDARTATVTIPGLSRAPHSIVITYEYTDSNGTITLAQFDTDVDLTNGNDSVNIDPTLYNFAFDEDADNIDNATELLQGTDPYKSDLVVGGGFTISVETATPLLTQAAQTNGTLRGYVTIDNGTRREITLIPNEPIATIDIINLSQTTHNVLVTFEYTNNAGITYTLADATKNADLTLSGKVVPIIRSDLNTDKFDNDNDGTSNFAELIRNTDPLARGIPFVAAALSINTDQLNTLFFSWVDVPDADFYRLFESIEGTGPFTKVGEDTLAGAQFKTVNHIVTKPVLLHIDDKYKLQSCNELGCIDSAIIDGAESFAEVITYLKADNTNPQFETLRFGGSIDISSDGKTLAVADGSRGTLAQTLNGSATIFINANGNWTQLSRLVGDRIINGDHFGTNLALSGDGQTLAISSTSDSNSVAGIIHSNDLNPPARVDTAADSGAVYIFTNTNNTWVQQAYIKTDNPTPKSFFGSDLDLSVNGNTLVVSASNKELVYIFSRSNSTWSQQATITSSNNEPNDFFGQQVSISNDGLTIAVTATGESSQGTGIDNSNFADTLPPSQTDNSLAGSGAAYIFTLTTPNTWTQQAYIKTNIKAITGERFGISAALSNNGNTLAIGSKELTLGDRNTLVSLGGAVYIYTRNNNVWTQQDRIKPNDIKPLGLFGDSLDFNGDGSSLAIGSSGEKSLSGAAFLFKRTNNSWNQTKYLKFNTLDSLDAFGESVSLSDDALTLAVGAPGDASSATGINGNKNNNDGGNPGAVYVY